MFDWLETIYSLVADRKVDDAIDVVLDNIDDMLLAGEFGQCDRALSAVDLDRLDTNLMVCFMSVTLAAKRHLQNRAAFVDAVERKLEDTRPDSTKRLMHHLR